MEEVANENLLEVDNSANGDIELNSDIKELVIKVRNTAKKFRHSPVYNDSLQKYIKAAWGKRLQLLIDVITRLVSIFE